MPIEVQCDACFYSFSVKDEHAGKKGKCPECGTAVQIPGRGSRASGSSSGARPAPEIRRPSRPASAKPSSRSSSSKGGSGGSNLGLILGIGGGALVVLLGLVAFIAIRLASGPPANAAAAGPLANAGAPPAAAPAAAGPAGVNSAARPAGGAPSPAGAATPANVNPPANTGARAQNASAKAGGDARPGGATGAGASSGPATSASERKKYDVPDLIEAVEPSVCRIDVKAPNGGGQGSGFVVDTQGTVVTNYHVIAGGNEASVSFPDKSAGKVLGIMVLDQKRDLAILKIEYPADKLHPARLATQDPRKGEEVVAIGAPLGLNFTATEGKISAMRSAEEVSIYGKEVQGTWIQTSTPISPGNSGGPLFNMYGEVVAANTMSIAGANAQNLNFGTSYANIREVLDKKSDKLLALSPKNAPALASSSPRQPDVVDETRTPRGKKLLSEIHEVLIQEFNLSFDRTGEATGYVRAQAEKAWKQAGVNVTSKRDAPTFMLIKMWFKKGTGNANNSIMQIETKVYVRDESGKRPQICKVFEDEGEVGVISETALSKGQIPGGMKKKIEEFFGHMRTAYKAAGSEAEGKEEKAADKPDKQAAKKEEKPAVKKP